MTTENTQKVSEKVLYPELSYKIVGILFNAHTDLGQYAREKQYGDYIEKQLKSDNVSFKRELSISNSGNIIDFFIDEKIVLELKSVRKISPDCYRQIQNYLQHTGAKLGILVNFRTLHLRPIRILKIERT